MTPDQFDSFRMGVDLTSATYTGAEQVTNGDFANGGTGWSYNASLWSFAANGAIMSPTTSFEPLVQACMVAGQTYDVTVVLADVSGEIKIGSNTAASDVAEDITTDGTYTASITASTDTLRIARNNKNVVSACRVVSVSVTAQSGGTFTDLVQGAGCWTLQGGAPSFETRNGLEGMLFDGSLSVEADMKALHEACVVVIGQGATGTQTALFGGPSSANSYWAFLNSNTLITRAPPATQANASSAGAASAAPTVFTSGFYPKGGQLFSQVNALAPTASSGGGKNARINFPRIAIGRHRSSYFNGWIARVLVFDRHLPERDPDGFAALITAEMARVGL